MDQLLVKVPGEQQAEQILGDGVDGTLGRQIFAVQMIDAADAGIGLDKLVGQPGDSFHNRDLPQIQAGNKV